MLTSLAQSTPIWVYQHVPVLVFIFAFGSIVGSFINVVIYRLPEQMSVITPPSRCPTCGARLAWHENLPIIGWFIVGGRCRHCGVRISPQYMLVELFMAVLFAGMYAAYYMAGPAVTWWGEVGGPWWSYNWIWRTLPAFIMLLFVLAGLVAMTVIDARTFTIPMGIPRVLTIIAFVGWPLQAVWIGVLGSATTTWGMWPVQTTGWPWFGAAAGGMLGVGAGMLMLSRSVLRYSFADYDEHVPPGQAIGDYPHARREMGVELLFLLPCIAGIAGGYWLGRLGAGVTPPVIVQALGGSMLGYLVGGGVVWGVRFFGTLGFGREAMGLGDVHLMGAVGAVLGWVDPVFIFLAAPFFGLTWAFLSMGVSSLFRKERRELPYGPHLAVATLVLLLCRPALNWVILHYAPFMPLPGLQP